mmetsp:Transcript_2847/g.6979  ORF Transcript_2847/g.6979 Transcript_2847/m.6979 type:complete len:265 (-) Transcript_2847:727-1521(-)
MGSIAVVRRSASSLHGLRRGGGRGGLRSKMTEAGIGFSISTRGRIWRMRAVWASMLRTRLATRCSCCPGCGEAMELSCSSRVCVRGSSPDIPISFFSAALARSIASNASCIEADTASSTACVCVSRRRSPSRALRKSTWGATPGELGEAERKREVTGAEGVTAGVWGSVADGTAGGCPVSVGAGAGMAIDTAAGVLGEAGASSAGAFLRSLDPDVATESASWESGVRGVADTKLIVVWRAISRSRLISMSSSSSSRTSPSLSAS